MMNKRRKKDDEFPTNELSITINYDESMSIDNSDTIVSNEQNGIIYNNESIIMQMNDENINDNLILNDNEFINLKKTRKVKQHVLSNDEIEKFYDTLKPNKLYRLSKLPELSTSLYPYQKQAIGWMIQMEKRNKIRGGILADEPGLGKTIEVLSVILLNSYDAKVTKSNSNLSELSDLPATLIVCPSVLMKHWRQEIKKHCPQLNSWIYHGIGGLSAKQKDMLKNNKNIFQKRDVVITSYEVLSKDFNFTLSPRVKTRSSTSEFEKTQSPLTSFRWWRVCIDEAQLCSTVSSQTARMILKISSIYRWAITGTPINKDFEDLKGLLVFLDCEEQWYQSTNKLFKFLKTIMWRSSKRNISQDIIISEKKENQITIDVPDLELFAYMKVMKHKKNESKPGITDIELFSSAPYCAESLSKISMAVEYTQSKFFKNLTNELNDEIYQLQLQLCKKLNQLGDLFYFNNKFEEAVRVFRMSYDISHQTNNPIFCNFFPTFQPETREQHLGIVGYHSIRGIRNSNEKLGLHNDLKELSYIEACCKNKALASEEFHYLSELESFKLIKKELSRLIRNRVNYQRDPWWICALHYLNDNQPDFLQNLKDGVEQQYDTKFHGYRKSVLQLEVEGISDIIVLLENEFNVIYNSRKEFLEHCLFDVNIDEVNPTIYKTKIEEAERFLNKYLRCLVYEDNLADEYERIKLNIAERILMYIEYCIILDYNPTMKAFFKNPLSPNQIKKLNELSFFLLMSDAHFKELELMKLEIERADRLLKEKKLFIQHLIELNMIQNKDNLNRETLIQEIKKDIYSIQERQWEIEFTINNCKKEISYREAYGEKLSIVVKLLESSLNSPKDKALVFSYRVEALVQLSRLLDQVNIQYRFGKETGKANASAGTLKQRLEAFRTQDNVKVLLLNSHSLSSTLTLSQANHVLFLDPVGNANEDKVIDYLNRIGQDKCLNIYRFNVNRVDFEKPEFKIPLELEELLVLN